MKYNNYHIKKIILSILYILFLCVISSCSFITDEEQPFLPPDIKSYIPADYQLAVVSKGNLTKELNAYAQKIYIREETFSFSEDNLQYKNIRVASGDYVKKGDVLIELENSDLLRKLNEADYMLSLLEIDYRQTVEIYLCQ